jgi:hypothetical protein
MASDTAAATFVTGAAGFIGTELVKVLVARGHQCSVSRGQWRRRTACVVPGRPHAQWTVREPGKRSRELVHPNRIVVHEEIPTGSFAVLREMHQRTGTVVDVDRRHPRLGLPKLQHAATSHDRFDDAFFKP